MNKSLAGVAVLLLLTGGCTTARTPSAAGPPSPATPPAGASPAGPSGPPSSSGTDGPPSSGTDGSPAGPLIKVVRPASGAREAAGAELGEAAPIPGSTILRWPAPSGPGAHPRGTHPTVVFHGPRNRKEIALTFDSNMTDAMLRRLAGGKVKSYANTAVVDELQKSHTPATFFLAGKWVEAYPQLTRRIAADPQFEVASHSWAHEGFRGKCYGLGTISKAGMAADVERSFQVLGRYTSRPTRFFRFPGGCYDAAALEAIAPAGCTVVEYDDVSGDAFGSNAARITADTVQNAKPGSIVVLHITEANAPQTAIALPAIIERLRAEGYRLVTLGDLLG